MRTRKTEEQARKDVKRRLLDNLGKITTSDKSLQENIKIMIDDMEAGNKNAENADNLMFNIFDGLSIAEYKIKNYLKILLIINDDELVINANNKEISEMNCLIIENINIEAIKLSDYGQIILGIREYTA